MRNLCTLLSSIVLLAVSSVAHAEELTPKELDAFGWEYVGRQVTVYGFLQDVYGCKQPSNKGAVCTEIVYADEVFDHIIFAHGIRSASIQPVIKSCVKFVGVVEDRDIQVEGAMTSFPALIASEFETVSAAQCETE
jgi:hypothetical protein